MFTLNAPAKINWFLHVLGKRNDGFHEIESLIQKITLCDRLTFSPSDNLAVKTGAPIPSEQNLALKAAKMMRLRYRVDKGATIHLDKEIPMGAGLGGGSSDAAAVLRGLTRLWVLNVPEAELNSMAAELGSDVPFFLQGPLAFAHGRGEKLMPLRALKPLSLLLVKPSVDVSTEWVYKNFALLTKKAQKVDNIELFIRSIERAELGGLACDISNDLESVTMNNYPEIAEIKEALNRQGSVYSLMSGSGSTVFGVFRSRRMAEDASRTFQGYWTATVETLVDDNRVRGKD